MSAVPVNGKLLPPELGSVIEVTLIVLETADGTS